MRLLLVLLFAGLAHAEAPDALSIAAESKVSYILVHKMHKVEGTSTKIEGKALILPDGKAQVMVRVPVESFDSKNVNRDAHMKEAVEAARFPFVEIKALVDGIARPASFPATVKRPLKAQISFHGEKKLREFPVEVTWESPTRAVAVTSFHISLDEFKVERPSLMFVKVDDDLILDAKLVFTR